MTVRRIRKWRVPADARSHRIGGGPVVHVASEGPNMVVVWTDERDDLSVRRRVARVYGTGQPLPADAEHVGSTTIGPFVWHVLVRPQS